MAVVHRRILLGGVLGVIASFLFLGGMALVVVGGSLYYVVAGLGVAASAYFVARGNRRGLWLYGAVLAGTLVWSLMEVGMDTWGLQARLLAPLALGIWVFWPSLRRIPAAALIALLLLVVGGITALLYPPNRFESVAAAAPMPSSGPADWPQYGKDLGGSRFSEATQINAANVAQLAPAWTYRTGDLTAYAAFEATPLMVDDTLYLCTPSNIIIALDPDTGARRWVFDPKADAPPGTKCRGVAYFHAHERVGTCSRRIILGTGDGRLMAVDAETGLPCQDFGEAGTVDLKADLGEVPRGYYAVTSAPAIVRGKIIVNAYVMDGQMVGEPSGVIRAFDAMSGHLAWAWDMDRPDEHGPPPAGKTYSRGTDNSWGPMSGDETLGLVYLPMGNSTPDYWGAHRSKASETYSSAVVALDADSGMLRWSYQTVHHDLWDYDVPSQPTLIDLRIGGQMVPALVQATKQGQLFLLDRREGTLLAKVEERPVPQGPAEGDFVSPTQPFSTGLPAFDDTVWSERTMWGLTPLDQLWCRIKFRQARYEGPMTPPGIKPTITYPGFMGGTEWGGVAVDPERHLVVVNWSRMANYTQLIPRAEVPDLQASTDGRMGVNQLTAQLGTPFAVRTKAFLSPLDVPCNEPPFGKIAVVDLDSRKVVWQRPLGTAVDSGPLGLRLGIPLAMGVPNVGGALLTRAGLIFIAATQERAIRAFDVQTGKLLWHASLATVGTATPMTYISPKTGRQYVVISAGGFAAFYAPTKDHVIAFALPEKH